MRRTTTAQRLALLLTIGAAAGIAAAQDEEPTHSVWWLFKESADLFTIVLVAGSLAAVTQIVRVLLDVRERVIAPGGTTERLTTAIAHADENPEGVRAAVEEDPTFVPTVLAAALDAQPRGRVAMREAAEIEASVQAARWFRRIEPLNVIGNLGPLVGLAGTVWGMIVAFTALGEAGGEAGPAQLSLGISKALFHTLLGLLLAIPCLLVFGLYRGLIDRVCNRAMVDAARLLERLPAPDDPAPQAPKGARGRGSARKKAGDA